MTLRSAVLHSECGKRLPSSTANQNPALADIRVRGANVICFSTHITYASPPYGQCVYGFLDHGVCRGIADNIVFTPVRVSSLRVRYSVIAHITRPFSLRLQSLDFVGDFNRRGIYAAYRPFIACHISTIRIGKILGITQFQTAAEQSYVSASLNITTEYVSVLTTILPFSSTVNNLSMPSICCS